MKSDFKWFSLEMHIMLCLILFKPIKGFRNRIFLSDCSQLQTSHTVCSDSALSGETSKLGILAQKMIISPDQLSNLRSLISVFSVSTGTLNSQ